MSVNTSSGIDSERAKRAGGAYSGSSGGFREGWSCQCPRGQGRRSACAVRNALRYVISLSNFNDALASPRPLASALKGARSGGNRKARARA